MNLTKEQKEKSEQHFELAKNVVSQMCQQFNLPIIKCFRNNRISMTLGYFECTSLTNRTAKDSKIYFSMKDFAILSPTTITMIAIHESLHYICYMLNKPFNDGDDYFEKMLVKYHGGSAYNDNLKIGLSDENWKKIKQMNRRVHYWYEVRCQYCHHNIKNRDGVLEHFSLQQAKDCISHCKCSICHKDYEIIRHREVI